MDFFSLNFSILRKQLVPVRMRTDRVQAWLRALTQPIEKLFEAFTTSRNANNYYLVHNGQICHMEAVLNDRFDASLRRIAIRNGPFFDPIYVFLEYEDWPVYLATDDELTIDTPDYEAPMYLFVYCPGSVGVYTLDEQKEMRGLIEKYRLPSKRNYSIVDGPAPPLDL